MNVYTLTVTGSFGRLDLSLDLDIYRDLTDADERLISKHVDALRVGLIEESYRSNFSLQQSLRDEEYKLESLFGDRKIFIEKVENEYTQGHPSSASWLVVTTNKGRIKVGWRKHVISIDWSDSVIKGSGYDLFPDEDVIRWAVGIHAWGYEKAQEYINKLLA